MTGCDEQSHALDTAGDSSETYSFPSREEQELPLIHLRGATGRQCSLLTVLRASKVLVMPSRVFSKVQLS